MIRTWVRQERQLLVETMLGERFAERRHETGGRCEEVAVTVLTRLQPEGDREMALADPGRSEQKGVIAAFDVAAGGELADELQIDRGLKLEVEALERF
jgi:hypothetical protein